MRRPPPIGVDWGDIGLNAFSGLHMAGKVVATAFGGGGLADTVEDLESPILKDWAKKPKPPTPPTGPGPGAPKMKATMRPVPPREMLKQAVAAGQAYKVEQAQNRTRNIVLGVGLAGAVGCLMYVVLRRR